LKERGEPVQYSGISFEFDFDDDAQMRARLPKLAAIFLDEK